MTIKAEVKTMALKNLFDMVKADRYTQDGREALIKAQEEETEDKVYQIGEISQKTGLQKTANGWVKPKSGKQPGAKENGPLSPAKRKADRIAKMQKETGKAAPYGRTLKGTPKTPDDNPLTERTQKRAEGSKKLDYQVTEKGGKFYATGHQISDGSQIRAGPLVSEKELH